MDTQRKIELLLQAGVRASLNYRDELWGVTLTVDVNQVVISHGVRRPALDAALNDAMEQFIRYASPFRKAANTMTHLIQQES